MSPVRWTTVVINVKQSWDPNVNLEKHQPGNKRNKIIYYPNTTPAAAAKGIWFIARWKLVRHSIACQIDGLLGLVSINTQKLYIVRYPLLRFWIIRDNRKFIDSNYRLQENICERVQTRKGEC